MSRAAFGSRTVRAGRKTVVKYVRVPARKAVKYKRVSNPTAGKTVWRTRSGKPVRWSFADALRWSEKLAKTQTPAQRAEGNRAWKVLRRAGLV